MIEIPPLKFSPTFLNRIRLARPKPTGGIWYCYPTPCGWDLAAFNAHGRIAPLSPVDEEARVFHVLQFEDVVCDLGRSWQVESLPLDRHVYRGLPRGRISRAPDGDWRLEHGGEFATQPIRQLFGLSSTAVHELIVDHETTEPRHVTIVEQTLRHKTGNDRRIAQAFHALRQCSARFPGDGPLSASSQASMARENIGEDGLDQ